MTVPFEHAQLMKTLLGIFLAAAVTMLPACGQVITPQPTTETWPAGASTPTLTTTPRPTATAPLRPPATTSTPTITPTPIIHVVEQGETLQGIAFDYAVSAAELQAVNDVENPLLLQVGQRLTIPTDGESSEETRGLLLPTPTPLPFDKQGIAFYQTPVGSLECLGEVANTTPFTLTNVQLQVTLFDAAGEQLIEADTFAAADFIPPGAQSPFSILFTNPPPTWARSQVTALRGEAAGELAASHVPIGVTEVDGQTVGPQFQVSGLVENTSAETAAGAVTVIVTTYDAQGLVTGVWQRPVELEGTLAAGAAAPFNMAFGFYGDVVADFSLIALGRTPAE